MLAAPTLLLLLSLPARASVVPEAFPPEPVVEEAVAREPSCEEALSGPRGVLAGQVQLFGSGAVLGGARVVLLDDGGAPLCTVTADAEGHFELPVPVPLARLEVLHDQAEPLGMEEELGADERLEVVYRLRPGTADAVIVVYGEREREEVSRVVISGEELRQIPGSFGDPVRALQSLPGVARPQAFEGALVIRGAEGINTGFYVDEMPVPFMFHALVGKSIVNPAFVDDVEFYAGGMPSRFGEVLQGVVNVRTDTAGVQGHRGEVDLNVLDIGGALEVGREKWTVRSAGRISWVGNLIGLAAGIAVIRQGGSLKEASYLYPTYWDLLLSAERDLPDARLSTTLLASRDGLYLHRSEWEGQPDYDALLPFNPDHLIDSVFARWRVRYQQTGEDHDSDSWIAAGPRLQQSLLGDPFMTGEGPYYGRVDGWSFLGRREDRWRLSDQHRLLAGGQASVETLEVQDYTWAFSEAARIPTSDDVQLAAAVFGEWQWRPGAWLVAPGLRGSFHRFNATNYFEPEPRLTLRRQLDEDLALEAFVGRFTQVPPVERYAEGTGNPDLPLMRAWQASFGGDWSSGPWTVDTALFASHMRHLVVQDTELVFRADYEGGRLYDESVPIYPEVTGQAFGWESMVRLEPGGSLWGWAALTLSRSLRIEDDGSVFPGDYDQPVALTLLGAWDAPRSWQVSGRFRITSGHPFTPLYGVYDPQWDWYYAYAGETNSDRFPWFHQLDLRVEKTWQARRLDWSLYLDVYNLYWARNPIVAEYNYDYSRMITIIHIPIVPSMGLLAKF